MTDLRIKTKRLELIASNRELAQAEVYNRARFAELLQVQVPESWPPPYNDINTMTFNLQRLEEAEDQTGWWVWYIVRHSNAAEQRVLIGNTGYKGKPTATGTIEIGYALLSLFQHQGYATEAVQGLLGWAFQHAEVTRVVAKTLAILPSSIRLLERCDFTPTQRDCEAGVLCFELLRDVWQTKVFS